jgi:hypothetical protein
VSEHIDRTTLVAYVDGDQTLDREAIIRHVFACQRCRERMDDIQQLLFLVRDRDVLTFIAEDNDRDAAALREDLVATEAMERREAAEAELIFRDLSGRPIDTWDILAAADVSYRSTALARRIISAAESELDRRPQRALQLSEFAERWLRGDTSLSRLLLGEAWKQRGNALRQLMRYKEALTAAEIAETFYSSVTNTEFDIGQTTSSFRSAKQWPLRKALSFARASISNGEISTRLNRGGERFSPCSNVSATKSNSRASKRISPNVIGFAVRLIWR